MTDSETSDREFSTRRGGVFRSLLLPMLLLVFVTALIGSVWTVYVQGQDEREQLRETLRGNAALMGRLNLPRSERLVENFALAAGYPMAVVDPAEGPVFSPGWSESEQELAMLACGDESNLAKAGSTEVIAVPLEKNRGFFVLLNRRATWLVWSGWQTWLIFGSVLFIGGLVAYALARRLVGPLVDLAGRAPEMEFGSLPRELMVRDDELGTLARALQAARQRMLDERERRKQSERLAMLGQIATGLAHEIKNPAAAILVRAEHLQQTCGESSRAIQQEAEEILSLVNQWLFIARPESPHRQRADLIAPLRGLAERLQPVLNFRQVELTLVVPEAVELTYDQQRLMQAVRNLIDNAIAAMPGGGGLRLAVNDEVDQIRISVSDEGAGFSEQALARFAEPFFSEKEGGMGLGLALVKGVVEAHGGSLQGCNSPEGGALVELEIPKN